MVEEGGMLAVFTRVGLEGSEKVDVHQSRRCVCFHGNAVGQVSCLFFGQPKGEDFGIKQHGKEKMFEFQSKLSVNKPSAFLSHPSSLEIPNTTCSTERRT